MTYTEYMNRAKEMCIIEDEDTGLSYLIPDFRFILYSAEMYETVVSDYEDFTIDIVAEVLKLEVENRNRKADKTGIVAQWAYDVIMTNIDPAITEMDNDLLKNLTEYMVVNDTLKDKEKELIQREDNANKKENITTLFPGMNFSKKKP